MAAVISSDSACLLCQCIQARDLESVRTCLMDSPHLVTCTKMRESEFDCCFLMAVMRRNAHLAELLLDHSKDIDQLYGDNKESLIHLAIREDDEEMVKVLIHFGANLNITIANGYTPLGLALTVDTPRGTAIAKILVRSGALPNMKTVISFCDKTKYTPLRIACFKRNLDFVKFLVEETFTQNDEFFGDYCEETSSEIATPYSIWNERDNKQLVLVKEKDNSMTSKSGREESHKSLTQRMKHLLNQGAGDVSTPLYMAASGGDLQIVEYLITAGADPHFACLSGNFLHAAVNSECLDVIKKGFKLGCDVNHRNAVGDTPLHLAGRLNLAEICELLLTGGADLKALNRRDLTPLHQSLFTGSDKSATVLIQHGSDVNAVDMNKTPFYLFFGTHEDTIRFLLLAGARLTTQMLTASHFTSLVTIDEDLSSWMQEHISQPRSLQALCGLNIRSQLINVSNGKSILWRTEALEIPKPLKDLVFLRK